jgi:hypothetical protein
VDGVRRGLASFFQERFAHRHAELSNTAILNVTVRLDITGRLDRTVLDYALTAVVERHHALRTRFGYRDGQLEQEVLEARPVLLDPVDDLDAGRLTAAEREAAVSHWCLAQAIVPFALADDGLVRFALASVAADQWVLTIVQHHIITDALSTVVLLSDLAAFYRARAEGRDADLSPPAAQSLDFAHWQRNRLTGDVEQRLLGYWRDDLAEANFALPLPGEHPRPPVLSGHGDLHKLRLPVDVSAGLDEWVRSQRVSLYAVLLVGFGRLLSGLTDQDEVVVTGPFHNRTRPEFEATVGQLANTLPLRLRQRPDEVMADAARRTGRMLWHHSDHQELPFPTMLERLAIRQRPGAAQFPQVWLSLHPRGGPRVDIPGLHVTASDVAVPGARSDLGILVVRGDDGLELWAESSDFLGTRRAWSWIQEYAHLLQRFVADPSGPVGRW